MDGAVLLVIYRLAQRARHEGGVDGLQRASAVGVFVAIPPRPTRMGGRILNFGLSDQKKERKKGGSKIEAKQPSIHSTSRVEESQR